MAFTPQLLAAEINTDPRALGYGPLVLTKDRIGIAAKLNAAGSATPGVAIWRTDVTSAEIMASIVWTEVSTATVTQWTALQTLLIPPTTDASKATVRALFAGLFTGAPTSLANVTAVAKSALSSRAEELWGYGVRITEQDVANAGVN